jgi:hypothetical protein
MFDKKAFESSFAKALRRITASERVSKEVLRDLSRSLLECVHECGDASHVNKLMVVLTPMNKKLCALFFREHIGYTYDEKLSVFTKKNKAHYEAAKAKAQALLADPNQNLWTWAERQKMEVAPAPYDVSKVTDYIKAALQKATGNGLSQVDVMKAIIAGGITADTIIACMDVLGYDVAGDVPAATAAAEPAPF